MNELIFTFIFILPIAWYVGFHHGQKKEVKNSFGRQHGLSKSYFTGLNYLLNEESDKAIDTFMSMLEVDSETVEIHLALASLSRKRGEVNRAIRIHQNLIARPSLSSEDRRQSLLELGYDYMSAGLLDRAENIFIELSDDSAHKNASLSELLIIYQQTKDWQKAIATADKLQLPVNDVTANQISHFYCELAEKSLKQHHVKEALVYINKAFKIYPQCVRATLISAEIHRSNGRHKQAIKCYTELIKQDVAFLPEALDDLLHCYTQLGDMQGLLAFLKNALACGGGISCILAYAELLQSQQNDWVAAEFIVKQMEQDPSIRGLLRFIDLQIAVAGNKQPSQLRQMQAIVTKLQQNKPLYHCEHCGFDSKTLFWQCPSCKCWGGVKPIL